MYAITADQIDSRHDEDRVDRTIAEIDDRLGDRLALPVERTAGDELQLLAATPDAAVDALLALTRPGVWSVGLGIGEVDQPLPASTRAASGPALFAARSAVERAKDASMHVAVDVQSGRRLGTSETEPLVAQTVRLLARRSPEGWELADLLEQGLSRRAAAGALGISQQAVAKRYAAAALGDDAAVRHALIRLLRDADTVETVGSAATSESEDRA